MTPTVDPLSFNLSYNDNDASKVAEQQEHMKRLGSTLISPMRVEDIKPDQFDVIFLVGGTGRCRTWQCIRPRKIVAAVKHRPAGLFTASRADRIVEHRYECKDRQLTGFSNEEETQAGLSGNAPWLLEDRLRISGARYIAKAPWTPHAVVDGNLVTGQQNYSASVTADAVLKQLAVQKQVAATI